MYTIQYEAIDGTHKMQKLYGSTRNKLLIHLASFARPIIAVYENSTVVTKTVRKDLESFVCTKNQHARNFIKNQD